LKKVDGIFWSCLVCLVLTLGFSACGTTGSSIGSSFTSSREPDWVRDPYTRYNRNANVAAVGSGASREAAEKSAFGNLVGIFGQSIQVDERVSTSYQQAVRSGVTANWSENTEIDSMVSTSASLDSLLGAEIGDVWNNNRTFYAMAVMNKANAVRIYTDIVQSNQTMIDNLIDIPLADKNTLEGYARYQFAATVADMTMPYVNLLSVVGGPALAFKKGDDYRIEAANIAKNIPVALNVRNDRVGRIEGAFAKVFSNLGFQSGGNNSRYVLDVNIVTSEVVYPNDTRNLKWTRIEIAANLTDTASETVLLPYNINNREGGLSLDLADNIAYISAERKINDEYANLLSDYINQLLPKR